jgi:hypothetical protein
LLLMKEIVLDICFYSVFFHKTIVLPPVGNE